MKVEAKETRLKINKTNDDTLRKQARQEKFMKILNHRNPDTFVDLLIKKEQDKRQRMKEEFEKQDRIRAVAGS